MKLYESLEKELKKESEFVSDEDELKKWVVINKAQNSDAGLIELLLGNKELKEKFFIKVKDVLVFNKSLFIQFLEQKNYLNDSSTAYKNKVGLTIDGKYMKQRNEVALVWPFKDCVLEGGQSKEEDKREEIFFNETLAQDEITQLFEPKVLTNAKRYSAKGEKPLDKFNRNEEGTITDNLIIKGNNLLALHTLKEEFAGKVKIMTSNDDIILDFFGGSGTTAHATLELNKEDGKNRKFIIVEQLDKHSNINIERNQKVLVKLNLKDSFIYLELKKYNQSFIEQIELAKDTKTLLKIWEEMKARSFLNYNLDIKKQQEHIEEFKALKLAEQKKHLVEILDKNQLYVNLSSMNDKDFKVTEEEKKVTKDFYKNV